MRVLRWLILCGAAMSCGKEEFAAVDAAVVKIDAPAPMCIRGDGSSDDECSNFDLLFMADNIHKVRIWAPDAYAYCGYGTFNSNGSTQEGFRVVANHHGHYMGAWIRPGAGSSGQNNAWLNSSKTAYDIAYYKGRYYFGGAAAALVTLDPSIPDGGVKCVNKHPETERGISDLDNLGILGLAVSPNKQYLVSAHTEGRIWQNVLHNDDPDNTHWECKRARFYTHKQDKLDELDDGGEQIQIGWGGESTQNHPTVTEILSIPEINLMIAAVEYWVWYISGQYKPRKFYGIYESADNGASWVLQSSFHVPLLTGMEDVINNNSYRNICNQATTPIRSLKHYDGTVYLVTENAVYTRVLRSSIRDTYVDKYNFNPWTCITSSINSEVARYKQFDVPLGAIMHDIAVFPHQQRFISGAYISSSGKGRIWNAQTGEYISETNQVVRSLECVPY